MGFQRVRCNWACTHVTLDRLSRCKKCLKDLEELKNKQSTINNKITEIKNTLEETWASLVAQLVKNQQ